MSALDMQAKLEATMTQLGKQAEQLLSAEASKFRYFLLQFFPVESSKYHHFVYSITDSDFPQPGAWELNFSSLR